MAIQCLTDPVTDPTKWQPVTSSTNQPKRQPSNAASRLDASESKLFQEWISSPSDPVSVANYSKHLTSKTKSLIQKLACKGFKHILKKKKHIETIQDIFLWKRTTSRNASITQSILHKKKRQNLQEKHLEKRESQSLLIFFEDIRLVNSLGAKSRAANAQAKRAKSCMDFMWQLQLVRLMPKENTTYYEFMRL